MDEQTRQAWYACENHIEVVLDQLVDEEGLAPDLFPFSEEEAEGKAVCRWCGGRPAYRLTVEH
ncbi:CxxH/CxxC protein [Salinithrix halophila]|uniref:CxxH/CxxC protein n=1 Tax=Salinithrix halophila TaxID=1485204 RepID=A0ABV8JIU6_9BACL